MGAEAGLPARQNVAARVLATAGRLPEVERAVTGIGYQLDRLDATRAASGADDDDELPKDLSHITPAYKRALWIVVGLNVGYGLIEIVGGFLAERAERESFPAFATRLTDEELGALAGREPARARAGRDEED